MFQSILVTVDVEHESSWKRALPVAAKFARDSGAALHVLSVVTPFGSSLVGGFFPDDYEQQMVAKVKSALAALVSDADLGGVEPKLHVARGTIYEEVLAAATSLGADLIVIASNRPELKDYLLGPNAARVVRHARQSVFVVRD